MGNAGHYLLPHVLRHVLEELGIGNYELWGVLLGPKVFSGLTADTQFNSQALLHALEHQARFGQRREYINGLRIDRDVPAYDRVFLLDDPMAPLSNGHIY